MSAARTMRLELAAYLEPFGLSVSAGAAGGTIGSRPGGRTRAVSVWDGDKLLTSVTLDTPGDVLSVVRHVHKLRPDVPLLPGGRPPRATKSRKATAPAAPPRPVAELEALFEEPADEGPAAFVEQLADEDVPAHTRRDDRSLPAASAPRPTTQAPPWDAIAAAAQAAAERASVGAPAPTRRLPGALHGCDVIARVRTLGQLDDDVPGPLVEAAAAGLRRRLPTWLVRDPAGRLSVLVTNTEAVAA